jgi:hypothetical protein
VDETGTRKKKQKISAPAGADLHLTLLSHLPSFDP